MSVKIYCPVCFSEIKKGGECTQGLIAESCCCPTCSKETRTLVVADVDVGEGAFRGYNVLSTSVVFISDASVVLRFL